MFSAAAFPEPPRNEIAKMECGFTSSDAFVVSGSEVRGGSPDADTTVRWTAATPPAPCVACAQRATSPQDGTLWFWEVVDGEVVAKVQAHAPGKTVCGLAVHPTEARGPAAAAGGDPHASTTSGSRGRQESP